MRWDPHKGYEEYFTRRSKWHRWFAWRPISVSYHDYRWLEWVERKGNYWAGEGHSGWNWEYR